MVSCYLHQRDISQYFHTSHTQSTGWQSWRKWTSNPGPFHLEPDAPLTQYLIEKDVKSKENFTQKWIISKILTKNQVRHWGAEQNTSLVLSIAMLKTRDVFCSAPQWRTWFLVNIFDIIHFCVKFSLLFTSFSMRYWVSGASGSRWKGPGFEVHFRQDCHPVDWVCEVWKYCDMSLWCR